MGGKDHLYLDDHRFSETPGRRNQGYWKPIEGLSPERISRLGIGLVPKAPHFSVLTVSGKTWW